MAATVSNEELIQRIEQLEKKVTDLEKKAKPEKDRTAVNILAYAVFLFLVFGGMIFLLSYKW